MEGTTQFRKPCQTTTNFWQCLRCQVSWNVRDSPGSGAPVPCPARNLLFSWFVPEILLNWALVTKSYNLPITLVNSLYITFEIIVTRDKFALSSLGVPITAGLWVELTVNFAKVTYLRARIIMRNSVFWAWSFCPGNPPKVSVCILLYLGTLKVL